MFEDWEDFGFRFGPFGVGFTGSGRGVRYARTETSHILRIRIGSEVKKQDIKARLVKSGSARDRVAANPGRGHPRGVRGPPPARAAYLGSNAKMARDRAEAGGGE